MKLSIVLSTQASRFQAATLQGDLDANLSHVFGMGYEGVELAIRDPSQLDPTALLEKVHDHGLAVAAIGTGQAFSEEGLSFTATDGRSRRAAMDRILGHLPLATQAGAPVIIGLIRGKLESLAGVDRARTWMLQALRTCARAAGEAGVRLALEPINREETNLINSVEEGLALIDQVGENSLGLLLDTYHMHREEKSIRDAIRRAGHRLFHFHVADSNRMHPGAGELDFSEIMGALRQASYTGFVSGEFLPEPDMVTAAKKSIRHLKAAMGDQP